MATRNVDILAVTREIIHGYTATTVNQQVWNLLIWPDHLCKVLLPRGFSPYFLFACSSSGINYRKFQQLSINRLYQFNKIHTHHKTTPAHYTVGKQAHKLLQF